MKVTVSGGQCLMNKKVIIFVTLPRLNLLRTVDNYNESKSIQYITNVNTINYLVQWAKLKIIHPTHFIFKILKLLQLQILINYHLVIYISWIKLNDTDIKLHKS